VHDNQYNQVTWHTAPSGPGPRLLLTGPICPPSHLLLTGCNLTWANNASNFTGTPVVRWSACGIGRHTDAGAGGRQRAPSAVQRLARLQRRMRRDRVEPGLVWAVLRAAGRRRVRDEVGRELHLRLYVVFRCERLPGHTVRAGTFYRAAVPPDITAGKPNPSSWTTPVAVLEPTNCNISQYFSNHRIVFGTPLA
jgi:hypothetical protein